MRVVADTNILISALLFGGLPAAFLNLAFAGAFQLVTSPSLLDELDEKLRLKFRLSTHDADLIRTRLESSAEVVSTTPTLSVITDDPDDDRVLECGILGHADFIVSGDRHLLQLATYETIAIVTSRQWMDRHSPTT